MNFEMSHGQMPEDPDYTDFGPQNADFLDDLDKQSSYLDRPDQDLALPPDVRAANILVDAENRIQAANQLLGVEFVDYDDDEELDVNGNEPATMEELWAQMAKNAEQAIPISKDARADMGQVGFGKVFADMELQNEVDEIFKPYTEAEKAVEDAASDLADESEDVNLSPDVRAAITLLEAEGDQLPQDPDSRSDEQ